MGSQARHAAEQHHLPSVVVYRGKSLPCAQKRLANEQRAESKQRGSDGAQQHRKQHRLGASDAVHAHGRCAEDADPERHSPELHDVEAAASSENDARPSQKEGGRQAGHEHGAVVVCQRPPTDAGGEHPRDDMVRRQQEKQGGEPDVGAAKRQRRARQPCIGKDGAQQGREHRLRWPRPRSAAPKRLDLLGCVVGHALPASSNGRCRFQDGCEWRPSKRLGARWITGCLGRH